MSKFLIVLVVIFVSSVLSASASTIYTVGDTSGWDMSSDLDSWQQKKTFYVGDILLFLYSSSYSVEKVAKETYDGCNTTNVIQSSSTGNTTFTLTNPGDEYFICGNKLYCHGGMKLHVYVEKAQSETAAPAPQPTSGDTSDVDPPLSSSAEFNRIIETNGVTMILIISMSLILYFV